MFAGANISVDVAKYLIDMTYVDNEEGETDELSLKLDDREGTWLKNWLNTKLEPQEKKAFKGKILQGFIVAQDWTGPGDTRALNCGIFEIDSVSYAGPPATLSIKATSIPYAGSLRQTLHNKEWENTNLQTIAGKIAGDCGMQLMYLSQFNPEYKRKEQIKKTDISFLAELCGQAGLALKITAQQVVIFDQAQFEAIPPVYYITAGSSNIKSYSLSTKTTDVSYSKAHVIYKDPLTQETIEAEYEPPNANKDGQTLEIKQKVSNKAEALQLAQKMLRAKNKGETSASFKLVGDVALVAGVTVMVQGYGEYDGRYIIEQATHKITGGYEVSLKMRSCLDGW